MNIETTPPADLPSVEPPLAENPDLKSLFEALLRRPLVLISHLAGNPRGATLKFILLTLGSMLLFGFVLGCFAKQDQLWAAPLKVAAGLAVAAVICFPSLYIFSTLSGARLGVAQLAACLASSLALAGLLMLGFAPAVWIFAESTDSLGFMGFLALGSWFVAFTFAVRLLKAAVLATGGTQTTPIIIWSVIFLLVSLQMTTSLRPILGRSDRFLPQEKRFFLEHWAQQVNRTLPAQTPTSPPSR